MKKICANLKKYAIDIIKRALADEEIESYSNLPDLQKEVP